MDRLSGKPMKPDQFIKHYKFVDEDSGQTIHDLQLIQVELCRVKDKLFPPTEELSLMNWWLSIFRFSNSYDDSIITQCADFNVTSCLQKFRKCFPG